MATVYIGSDHAGLELKAALVKRLSEKGHDVHDLGPVSYTHLIALVGLPRGAGGVRRRGRPDLRAARGAGLERQDGNGPSNWTTRILKPYARS